MMRRRSSLALVPLLALSAPQRLPSIDGPATPVRITLGQSVVPMTGPWRFHTGDDPGWADPNFDDSNWETVDLTPAAGAHDADVGLSGYVPGWTAMGHPGYFGYAWYRITLAVSAPQHTTLALAGPPDVDDAYQTFFNGRLLGSTGDFSHAPPVPYSIRPRLFQIPQSAGPNSGEREAPVVLAFRVWVSAGSIGESPDAGGIHIAPTFGEAGGVAARYRVQWLETFSGYVVDAIEAVLFAILALMSCALYAFDRTRSGYLWVSGALVLTALVRANQAFFAWTGYESAQTFELAKEVVLIPLALGAWTMAWRKWFRLDRPAWFPGAVCALTLLYLGSQLAGSSLFAAGTPHRLGPVPHLLSSSLHVLFAILLAGSVYDGIRLRGRAGWFALPAIALLSIGLFAQELSVLQIRGIWFPYGTGVSRTQFAYAGFAAALFALLVRELLSFGRRYRLVASDPPCQTMTG
jgi:hypothetical protein